MAWETGFLFTQDVALSIEIGRMTSKPALGAAAGKHREFAV